ncbi:MAG: hypothetical protein ATN31_07885 [Candidatus Epulonipiscioides saccharophilum]|nr:MAG: hypothetical protein ATN31_07885 [Epulopiscium sp. AS2M-Bin001]
MKKRLTQSGLSNMFKNFTSSIDGVNEAIIGLPLITITGSEDIRIENFSSIVEYSQNIIRLKTKSGIVSIVGENLLAKSMNQEAIVIKGKISGVSLK